MKKIQLIFKSSFLPFFFLVFFTLDLHAAVRGDCPPGANTTTVNGSGSGSVTDGDSANTWDSYSINIPSNGSLTIDYTSTDDTRVWFSNNSNNFCRNNRIMNDGESVSHTLTGLTTGETVYIQLRETVGGGRTSNYSFNLSFTPDAVSQTVWIKNGAGTSAYTDPSPYLNNSDATETLTIAGAAELFVTISGTLEQDNGGSCTWDYVTITDSAGATSQRYCDSINDSYTAVGPTVTLDFHSDGSVVASGVTVSIAAAPPPTVTPDTFSVNEDAANSTVVGTVNTTGTTPTSFTIVSGNNDGIFQIDNSGVITVADNTNLDYEITTSYSLSVRADSTQTGIAGTITINVNDVDESGGGTEPSACPTGADEAFREFCLRKKITVPGNMVTIGNTILVAPDTGDGTGTNDNVCDTYTNGAYISDATSTNNNYYLCEYWDDPARPSTSATIDNSHIPDPTNSSIEWAGLYWQAIVPDSESVTNMTIRIKNGNDAYVQTGYDKLDWGDGVGHSDYRSYSAFKDVTDILNNNNWLDGKYTVADIPVHEGKIPSLGSYGAWTLVIVYRNDREKLRNFSIYDGWRRLSGFATAADSEALINISGFYTPKQTPISSAVSVFTAEGDKRISGDYLYARNANNSDNFDVLTHTTGQTFNSSVVPDNFSRVPAPVNNQGIDIQTFQLGTSGENFLETTQSNIDFKFITTTSGSSRDTYFPSMIAFNTELYAPELCYDYAYKQFGQYFTEDNNGSFYPYIIGDSLHTDEPVTVELFIRNDEESDTDATNMTVRITDINSSQATYVPNSAYVTPPGEVFPQPATPNPLDEIYVGTVGGKEFFHIDYDLDLVGSSINMPIKAELEYTLILSDSSGNEVPIDFKTVLSENVPLCTEDNFAYYPDYSIFNVENSALSAIQRYNLPTQTANRAGDFRIVSYEQGNVHTRKGASMPVAVEIIDAKKYHDIKASCVEPDSSLTPRVWMLFENNATMVDFDKLAIDTAIANGMVSDQILNLSNPMTEAEDFYSFVRENAAFRVMYHTTDVGTDIQLLPGTCQGQQQPPCYTVGGFSDLPQLDVGSGPGNCNQDVDGNPNSTDKIPQYCGNAGTRGLDSLELAECMECIYGYNIRFICSRDNFALRPESFRVRLSDQEQSGPNTRFIADNDTPAITHANNNEYRIVAGYNYYAEINATNHQNDNATPGYYVSFRQDGEDGDRALSLKWWPFANDDVLCNDTDDHNKTVTLFNGAADMNLSNNQIGRYELNMFDRLWTSVDWDPNYRSHHVVNAAFFVNSSDCRDNSSFVPSQSSTTTTFQEDMSGCDISTDSHTNSDNNTLVYTDMPLRIFPYTFEHNTSLIPSIGPTTRSNGQTFVYIDTPPTMDANNTDMSYNMNGTFTAVAYNNVAVTNFVTQCYADNVDMDLHFTYNVPEPTETPYLSYSLKDVNATNSRVRPASGTDDFEVGQHNSSTTPFAITQDAGFFVRDMNGSITMDLGYNFARAYNRPLNPRFITFNDFNLTYNVNPTGIRADLETDFQIFGNKDLDHDVTFVYGRAKPSQYFYDDVITNNIDTPNSIVIYCDQDPITCSSIFNIETLQSKTEEFDWYLSRGHVTTDNDGNITLAASTGGDVTNDNPVAINNSGGVNNPNVNVSATVATRPLDVFIDFANTTNRWLIYNEDFDLIPSPYYRVRFIGQSDWAGAGDTGHTVGGETSIQKNRRLGW